jgi:CHAD domain-containing protein
MDAPMPNAETPPATSPAEYPLLGYLDELVEQLRTHVTKALKEFDEQGVHQSRVATRKLKAALDLYEPVLSKGRRKPFADELRKLRRRLGPMRDADVMLGHVAEFGRDEQGRLAPAAAWASDALERDRDAARDRSRRKASPSKVLSKLGRWWGIRDQFAEAAEAVDTLLAESLHLQTDAFAEQADLLLAQQQQRTSPLLPSLSEPSPTGATAQKPLDPHELRIAGKALRYTLEMASKQGHDLPKSVGKTFKQMQEHLGLWHDYVVLADRLLTEAVATHLGHFDAPLKDRVLDLSKASLRKATKELERFYKLWADRGEAICHGIRAAFPLSENVKAELSEVELAALDKAIVDPEPGGPAQSAPKDSEPPSVEPSIT